MENGTEKLLMGLMVVINIGLKQFADSLEDQDVDVIQVDWVPSAGGDQEMIDLLDNLL